MLNSGKPKISSQKTVVMFLGGPAHCQRAHDEKRNKPNLHEEVHLNLSAGPNPNPDPDPDLNPNTNPKWS